MKIAIVDDERPARSELSFLITDILPEAEILEAASGAAALELFLSTPDIGLAFLDINLNDMEGTTLAAAMQKILPEVPVVFATAYSDYAVKAFELNAADYILKPIEPDRLRAVLKKCMAVSNTTPSVSDPMESKIAIRFNRKVIFTDTRDIIYIETSGRGYNVHTRLKKIYGPSGGLTIQHTDGETRISFLIPISAPTHRAGDWVPAE